MKKLLMLIGFVGLVAGLSAAPANAEHGAEGCILTSPGAAEPPGGYNVAVESCTYEATVEGTWGGVGTFTVQIDRGGDGTVDETWTEAHGNTNPEGTVINGGDIVHASVGAASTLAIGNAGNH